MKAIHARCLNKAGITDPVLRLDFEQSRVLHAHFGRTYYLATLLLPQAKRPFVHSLYGFARYADEIVDNSAPETRYDELTTWSTEALTGIRTGASGDPIVRALVHTLRRWDIKVDWIEAFLGSMAMDLTTTEYATYHDLERYMYGSASVIGLQMTPILQPLSEEAFKRAKALGNAFQMTNFLRDVAEDLDRGRIYLPMEDLAAFGVTAEELGGRVITPRIRALLRFEIARTRDLYAFAEPGIAMLTPSSRPCIRTAFSLYQGILDEIERAGHDVFGRRARVPARRRLATAGMAYVNTHLRF